MMSRLLITNIQVSGDLSDAIVSKADFLVYRSDFKLSSDIEKAAFDCYMWFKQSNAPLYVYKDMKMPVELDEAYLVKNLGLFNDESVSSSDERAIPNKETKYNHEQLSDILRGVLTRRGIEFVL